MTSQLTYLWVRYGKYFVLVMLTKEILVELTSQPLHSPDWVFEICLLPLLVLFCGDCQNHFPKFQNKSSWNYAKSIIIWFGTFTKLSYSYPCSPLPTVLWILFTLQMSNIVFFPPVETVKIKRREQERESVKGMQCGDEVCFAGLELQEGGDARPAGRSLGESVLRPWGRAPGSECVHWGYLQKGRCLGHDWLELLSFSTASPSSSHIPLCSVGSGWRHRLLGVP